MDKIIDMKKSVFEICTEYPEVKDVMKELGFEMITNPAMLSTTGRFMTIPKGAKMKGIGMDKIEEVFISNGFKIKN